MTTDDDGCILRLVSKQQPTAPELRKPEGFMNNSFQVAESRAVFLPLLPDMHQRFARRMTMTVIYQNLTLANLFDFNY